MRNTRRAFTKAVKVRPNQLEWLRENKGKYSIAGKLDEIINCYKNEMYQLQKRDNRRTKS